MMISLRAGAGLDGLQNVCHTAVFGELQTALNLVWEVQPRPTGGVWGSIWAWLKRRILSLAMVFAGAFLLLVSLVVSAALASRNASRPNELFWPRTETSPWRRRFHIRLN